MRRIYEIELDAVQKYLNARDRRSKFRRLQEELRRFFLSLRYNSSLESQIVSVFTRADSDPDQPIKTDRKIAIKLHKWRNDPRDTKQYTPGDIHDIAGITVVCAFPSDLNEVVSYLNSKQPEPSYRFGSIEYRMPMENRGYSAYHGIVHGRGPLDGVKCELQLKTVLIQAWGQKTHDLTYKPAGDIDPRLTDYMEKLSHTVQLLDEQSELLKNQITEVWSLDVKRRTAARKQMLLQLHSEDSPAKDLIESFLENEDALAVNELTDGTVADFEDHLEAYEKQFGSDKDFCRVLTIYALNRRTSDRNDKALDAIDDWIERTELREDVEVDESIRAAKTFRSLAAMALGEYAEAISSGRWVLAEAQRIENERAIFSAKCNLAYFLSEACYHRYYDEPEGGGRLSRTGSNECGEEALSLISSIELGDYPEHILNAAKDTIGAVRICCSDDEDGIRSGLQLCREAFSASEGTDAHEAVKSFFDLHEKRAFRRLLALEKR